MASGTAARLPRSSDAARPAARGLAPLGASPPPSGQPSPSHLAGARPGEGPGRHMSAPKTRARRQRPARPQQPEPVQPAPEQPAPDLSRPGCAESAAQQVAGHAVSATCWLQPGDGQSYPASVSFSGRRAGITGRPREGAGSRRRRPSAPSCPAAGRSRSRRRWPMLPAGNGSSGRGRRAGQVTARGRARCPGRP